MAVECAIAIWAGKELSATFRNQNVRWTIAMEMEIVWMGNVYAVLVGQEHFAINVSPL